MKGIEELSRSDLSLALGCLSELASAHDATAVRDRVLGTLRELVPADSVTFTEIDLNSGEARWWTDPVEVGDRADAEAFAAHLDQHPIAGYHAARGGTEAVQFADFLSERELHRLDIYADFYRPLDVEHQIAIAVDAPGPLSIPISAQSADRSFDLRARAMLELLQPHLAGAYQRVALEERTAGLLRVLERSATAVVVLEGGDGIEFETERARSLLDGYLSDDGPPGRVPQAIAELLPGWRGRPGYGNVEAGGPPAVQVDGEDGSLTITYARVGGLEALVLEEQRIRPDPSKLRELGLTPREVEVLGAAVDGATAAELAERLTISPLTVKKHLENIYAKLDVSSRAEAVAIAMAPLSRRGGR